MWPVEAGIIEMKDSIWIIWMLLWVIWILGFYMSSLMNYKCYIYILYNVNWMLLDSKWVNLWIINADYLSS